MEYHKTYTHKIMHTQTDKLSEALPISSENTAFEKRQICQKCERPIKVCWCEYLPRPKISLKSGTSIIIIQHPSEKKRKIRTALMALHGLDNGDCKIFVRRKVANTDTLCELLENSNSYVLYPTATSKQIELIANDHEKKSLIILDGTWDEAKKIYSRSPILQRLPTIQLDIDKKSEYVVRTQPSEKCLSTIETIAHSLAILENDDSISEKLLNPLHVLCKFQLSHGAVEHDDKSFKKAKLNRMVESTDTKNLET